MDMLSLPEKGANWPNKPTISQHVDGYTWFNGDEDSEENRQAYMNYLQKCFADPTELRFGGCAARQTTTFSGTISGYCRGRESKSKWDDGCCYREVSAHSQFCSAEQH